MSAGDILERLHSAQAAFYAGGDRRPLEAVLTPDVTWHVPGDSTISGTYRGIETVLRYMARRRDLAARTFRMHPRELLIGPQHIAVITDGEVQRDGAVETWSTVGLYRIRTGRIAECHLLPFDQRAFDRIWSFGHRTAEPGDGG